LTLENTTTGTMDTCFDDSDVLSDENFYFMKIERQTKSKHV